MRRWNIIAWLLTGALMPLLRSLIANHCEPTVELQAVTSVYGYLVISGVIFNVLCLVAFIAEVIA